MPLWTPSPGNFLPLFEHTADEFFRRLNLQRNGDGHSPRWRGVGSCWGRLLYPPELWHSFNQRKWSTSWVKTPLGRCHGQRKGLLPLIRWMKREGLTFRSSDLAGVSRGGLPTTAAQQSRGRLQDCNFFDTVFVHQESNGTNVNRNRNIWYLLQVHRMRIDSAKSTWRFFNSPGRSGATHSPNSRACRRQTTTTYTEGWDVPLHNRAICISWSRLQYTAD